MASTERKVDAEEAITTTTTTTDITTTTTKSSLPLPPPPPSTPVLPRSKAIYVCDLPPKAAEAELAQLFRQFGELESIRQADKAPTPAIIVEYTTFEAAEEAQQTINLASLRGKTCRCLSVSALEMVRGSIVSRQRLVVENLDPAIELAGFWDACSLCGQVLDCNLQVLDEGKKSRCGFVHFARDVEAAYAAKVLDNMQIGDNRVRLRRFRSNDVNKFTGIQYASLLYGPYIDVTVTSFQ